MAPLAPLAKLLYHIVSPARPPAPSYVSKEGRALHAQALGRVLTAFLQAYFSRVGVLGLLFLLLGWAGLGWAVWRPCCSIAPRYEGCQLQSAAWAPAILPSSRQISPSSPS